MATKQEKWVMNDTQKAFVADVQNAGDNGITLFELKMAGKDYKTGSINTLLSKGIVVNAGEKEFACNVVYDGVVVGKVTKKAVIYKMA